MFEVHILCFNISLTFISPWSGKIEGDFYKMKIYESLNQDKDGGALNSKVNI